MRRRVDSRPVVESGWIIATDPTGDLREVIDCQSGGAQAAILEFRKRLDDEGWTIEPSAYPDEFFCHSGQIRHHVQLVTRFPGNRGERLAPATSHSTPGPATAKPVPVVIVVHLTCRHCGRIVRLSLNEIPTGKPGVIAGRLRCRVCGQRGASIDVKRYTGPGALVLRFPHGRRE